MGNSHSVWAHPKTSCPETEHLHTMNIAKQVHGNVYEALLKLSPIFVNFSEVFLRLWEAFGSFRKRSGAVGSLPEALTAMLCCRLCGPRSLKITDFL